MSRKPPSKKKQRITIKDVAKAAGVSVATVSYVLNHKPGHTISLGTRIRVFEASRELGYLPNPYARALGKRVSDEIAHVNFEPVKSYGMLEWLTFTQQRIQELGYTPGSYLYYGDSQDAMFEIYTGILARRPAAVITSKFLMTKEIYEYTKSVGVQACVLFNPTPLDYAPTIILPYRETGRLVGAHFLERGHRSIAFIKPSVPTPLRSQVSQECLKGMQSIFLNKKIKLVEFPMDTTFESARETMDKIMNCPEKPTAIFGFTDDYCLQLHRAIQERGLRMPDDLALVGSEDTELSNLISPSLSAVRLDVRALAFQGVDLADALIRGAEPSTEPLATQAVKLNIRETS